MTITESFVGSATIDTTEFSLPNNSTSLSARTDAGFYQVLLDLNALAFGDEFLLKVYEKVLSGGTQRLAMSATLFGGMVPKIYTLPLLGLLNGWDVTLDKIAGTNRSIEWSIRKISGCTEQATAIETVSGTEWSMVTDSGGPDADTNDVMTQIWLDVSAISAAADDFEFKRYEKVQSGGTQRVVEEVFHVTGAAPPILVMPAQVLMHGWDFTAKKIAGTDRSIIASVRKAA